jgi:putative glutamine amidotransferase
MLLAQHPGSRDELETIIARLITTPQHAPLGPGYRPLIGMPASASILADGQWRAMSADAASIEAVIAAGGEVRLIPLRFPHPEEDAIELVLQAVLPFDGLLFPGSNSDVDPRLYHQLPHPQTAPAEPLLDWWVMLMALVARQTLTPLFAICGGMQRLNVAFGGTLQQHLTGHRAESIEASNWTIRSLELDRESLHLCVKGNRLCSAPDDLSSLEQSSEICCMHHQAADQLAAGFLPWGWSEGIIEGFGYPGPDPWFALATQFHSEARVNGNDPLSHVLFQAFLAACRTYAGSLRDALKTSRMRDHILRRLYRDPLVQRFLQGPLVPQVRERG